MPARKDQQVDASVVEKRGAAVRNQTMWWQCGFFLVHELNKPLTAILGSADGDPYRFRKFLAESYYQFNTMCKRVCIDTSFDSGSKFIILLVSYTVVGNPRLCAGASSTRTSQLKAMIPIAAVHLPCGNHSQRRHIFAEINLKWKRSVLPKGSSEVVWQNAQVAQFS